MTREETQASTAISFSLTTRQRVECYDESAAVETLCQCHVVFCQRAAWQSHSTTPRHNLRKDNSIYLRQRLPAIWVTPLTTVSASPPHRVLCSP